MLYNKVGALLVAGMLMQGCASVPATAENRPAAIPLVPGFVVEGDQPFSMTLDSEMARLGVRALAYAAIRKGAVDATHVVGLEPDAEKPLLFQAASLSKPVAAVGLLRLAQQHGLDLDTDINRYLKGWKVDYAEQADAPPVTLRGLLSHTAGLGVSGFPGYAPQAARPDTLGVLTGKGNTEAVVLIQPPGQGWSYSGGGYTVAQLLAEELTGQSFAAFIGATVLGPLGMRDSHFDDLPGAPFAPTTGGDGTPLDAPYHVYPEKAAAGLWTTPQDMARFLVGVDAMVEGRSELLSPALAQALLTIPQGSGRYALGFAVDREPGKQVISHSGSNFGYKSFMFFDTVTDTGFVGMTGSENGSALIDALARGHAQQGGLAFMMPERIAPQAQDPTAMAKLVGTWEMQLGPADKRRFIFAPAGADRLHASEGPGDPGFTLYAVGSLRFVAPERRVMVDFTIDADGAPRGLVAGRIPLVRLN